MPEASAASVACSPVSRSRMKSLGSTSFATLPPPRARAPRSQSSLGAWKPVLARLPVIAITRSRPSPRVDLVALGMSARIVPQQGRADRVAGGVEEHRAVHLARQADAGDVVPRGGRRQLAQHRRRWPATRPPAPARSSPGAASAMDRRRSRAPGRLPSAASTMPLAPLVPMSMPIVAGCRPMRSASPVRSGRPDFTPLGPSSIAMRPLCQGRRPPLHETRTLLSPADPTRDAVVHLALPKGRMQEASCA